MSAASGQRAVLRAPGKNAPSLLLLLAMLLAFLGQSIVTQSHVHLAAEPFSPAASAGNGSAQTASTSKRGPSDSPADCPYCRELAMAGHVLLPAPVVLPERVLLAVGLFLAPVAFIGWRGRSHSWRSRAPPK